MTEKTGSDRVNRQNLQGLSFIPTRVWGNAVMNLFSQSPISVVILARDEGLRIRRCLESLTWAAEIIVLLDERTVDNTEQVALTFANVIVKKVEWEGYGATKNRGLDIASFDWVFWIDADEVVPVDLAREIMSIVDSRAENSDQLAFDLPRLTHFIDGWVRYCGWYPDRVVRLFRKSRCRLDSRALHEKVQVPIGYVVGHLQQDLLHYSYDDIGQYFDKMLRYAPLGARAAMDAGQSYPFFQIVVRPLITFLRSYFLRLGCLDGKRGFIICCGGAFSTFLRYCHLYYLRKSHQVQSKG